MARKKRRVKRDRKCLVGMNLRMTEISAAIAREQLKKLNNILKVYRKYGTELNVKTRPGCEHSYYKFVLTDKKYKANIKSKTPVIDNIRVGDQCNSLLIKKHYIDPIYKMPLFRELGYNQKQCPVCEKVNKDIMLSWFEFPI